MITTVNFVPHFYSPAYNPIVYSVTSDLNQETDMVYVFNVFVNGATAANFTFRQRPNPAGAGMIDISSSLQPFIDLTLYSVENDAFPTMYGNSQDIVATALVVVGEEYFTTTGAFVQEDGFGDLGPPQFPLGIQEGLLLPQLVLPAALPFQEAIDNMASEVDYVYWKDYFMDGNGKFLSQDSNPRLVYDYDYSTLSFINWNNDASAFNSSVQLIQYKQFGPTGALIRTDNLQNTTLVGGGPQSLPNYTSQAFDQDVAQLSVKVGPANLVTQGIWDNNTATYTVTAFVKASATSATTPGATASETITFQVLEDCNFLYPRVRLSWLNELGGRDYFNFTMFYQKVTQSPGSEYYQTPLDWSALKPVVIEQGGANTAPNYMRGGAKSFNKTVTQTLEIQTDFLTQQQVDYLGYISQSPDVLAYIGDTEIPLTCKLITVDYTYRLVKQVKLTQAIYTLQYTKVQPKQNL